MSISIEVSIALRGKLGGIFDLVVQLNDLRDQLTTYSVSMPSATRALIGMLISIIDYSRGLLNNHTYYMSLLGDNCIVKRIQ